MMTKPIFPVGIKVTIIKMSMYMMMMWMFIIIMMFTFMNGIHLSLSIVGGTRLPGVTANTIICTILVVFMPGITILILIRIICMWADMGILFMIRTGTRIPVAFGYVTMLPMLL